MKLGTAETLAFVLRSVPPHSDILEVGCGRGELAFELQQHGFGVTAIDSDEDAVEEAVRLGVTAFVCEWPHLPSSAFDAVLFTRSIHHISPLDAAVRTARECASRIVVEDFAPQEMSPAFAKWLSGELAARGEEWQAADVHAFSAIREEIARHFRIEKEERVPYSYRYFDAPYDRRIYDAEVARGELLGRRLVGVR